jgi:hypothetical protein
MYLPKYVLFSQQMPLFKKNRYYDPIHDRCHVDSKNGVRTEVAGRCSESMRGIIPTCSGHLDAYSPPPPDSMPAPATPVEVDATGNIEQPPSLPPSPPSEVSVPIFIYFS